MTDLELVIKAVRNTQMRLSLAAEYPSSIYLGAHMTMKVLLQELHAAAKAEENADGRAG